MSPKKFAAGFLLPQATVQLNFEARASSKNTLITFPMTPHLLRQQLGSRVNRSRIHGSGAAPASPKNPTCRPSQAPQASSKPLTLLSSALEKCSRSPCKTSKRGQKLAATAITYEGYCIPPRAGASLCHTRTYSPSPKHLGSKLNAKNAE